ncbi:MAG: VWA domain-containing protein, partial [Proteobacteria bacterium]|nr:VWA domain-containing protein [Pseudomonadota bacterium]
MRLRSSFIVFLICLFVIGTASAQTVNKYAQPRILILLDESSSMLADWQPGKPKIKVANSIILRLMDSIYAVNDRVEFSLRVFGSQ